MDQTVFADENLLSTVHVLRTLLQVTEGVLIRDEKGVLVGTVCVSGDTSDRDEKCAVHGVETAGLKADIGE